MVKPEVGSGAGEALEWASRSRLCGSKLTRTWAAGKIALKASATAPNCLLSCFSLPVTRT